MATNKKKKIELPPNDFQEPVLQQEVPAEKHRGYFPWVILILLTVMIGTYIVKQMSDLPITSVSVDLSKSTAVGGAVLSLSPSSNTINGTNQTFTVNIMLDTQGTAIDGVDIFYLRFNPAVLTIVDSNTSVTGTQISPGTLMPVTASNSADNVAGTLVFSQTVSGGSTFTGSGILGTITFKTLSLGTSNVTFDFNAGLTNDTNVASAGADILLSVTNGVYKVNTPPTVSITSPLSGASFNAPANITINATASDSNGTISKVEFYNGTTKLGEDTASPYSYAWSGVGAGTYSITAKAIDNDNAATTSTAVSVSVTNPAPTVSITSPATGTTYSAPASITINANATDSNGTISKVEFYNGITLLSSDTVSPYSFTWTGVSAGTYALTAKAYDNDSLTTTSTAVSVTVFPSVSIKVLLEGTTARAVSGQLSIYTPTKLLLKTYSFTTDSSGVANIGTDLTPQTVILKASVSGYLTRLLSNVNLSSTSTNVFPTLMAGDMNLDNFVNSLDWSLMNSNWFTSYALGDFNKDGIINSLDYSILNKNWFVGGEV
jgi:hypothetical protein